MRAQLASVLGDIGVDAVKTGMLASPSLVATGAAVLRDVEVPVAHRVHHRPPQRMFTAPGTHLGQRVLAPLRERLRTAVRITLVAEGVERHGRGGVLLREHDPRRDLDGADRPALVKIYLHRARNRSGSGC